MTDTLISRLEQATEGSRELDCLIENALGLAKFDRDPKVGFGDADYNRREPKPYSTSLDAAMSLFSDDWARADAIISAMTHLGNPDFMQDGKWLKLMPIRVVIASLKAAGYE